MRNKRTFVTLSAFTALMGGVYAFASYSYKVSSVPRQHDDEKGDFDNRITEGRKFIRNHPDRKDVFIDSADSIRLHANYIQAGENSHNYVILIHGIWDNNEANGVYAMHYLDRKVNCLLPDLRGFGKSEGTYIGYGYHDRHDIIEWINYLVKEDPEAKIIIHGMSMGAATTLMTTGEYLPKNVKAAIADSAYTTLPEQFSATYKTLKGSIVPIPIALFISRIIIGIRSGFDIKDVDCLSAVSRSTTPTLFIHGDDDTFIDPHMCSRLYEAASCKKQYLIIPGARHIEGVVKDSLTYWKKVDAFLTDHGIFSENE